MRDHNKQSLFVKTHFKIVAIGNNFQMLDHTCIPRHPCYDDMMHFCTDERVDQPEPAGHWKDITNERVQYHQHHHHSYDFRISMIPGLVALQWYFNHSQNLLNILLIITMIAITIMIRGEKIIQKWRVTFQRPPTYGKCNCNLDKYI